MLSLQMNDQWMKYQSMNALMNDRFIYERTTEQQFINNWSKAEQTSEQINHSYKILNSINKSIKQLNDWLIYRIKFPSFSYLNLNGLMFQTFKLLNFGENEKETRDCVDRAQKREEEEDSKSRAATRSLIPNFHTALPPPNMHVPARAQ